MEKDHHLESHYIRVCPLSPSQGFCGNLGWDPHIQAPGLFRSHRARISPMTQTLSAHAVDPAAGHPRSTAACAMPHAMQLLISKLLREGPGGCPAGSFPNPTGRCAPTYMFSKARSIWGNVKETRVSELLRGNNLSTEDRQENHQSWGVFTPIIPFPLGFLIVSVLQSLPLPPLLDPLF